MEDVQRQVQAVKQSSEETAAKLLETITELNTSQSTENLAKTIGKVIMIVKSQVQLAVNFLDSPMPSATFPLLVAHLQICPCRRIMGSTR